MGYVTVRLVLCNFQITQLLHVTGTIGTTFFKWYDMMLGYMSEPNGK